jgi:hypothetical protein
MANAPMCVGLGRDAPTWCDPLVLNCNRVISSLLGHMAGLAFCAIYSRVTGPDPTSFDNLLRSQFLLDLQRDYHCFHLDPGSKLFFLFW